MPRPIRVETITGKTIATALYETQRAAFDLALATSNTNPYVLARRYIVEGLIRDGLLPPGTPTEPAKVIGKGGRDYKQIAKAA